MKYDTIIIGAGAAGLCAAYTVASHAPQLNILVLEKESACGRKLNATGNGKCNLTNDAFSMSCYHSKDNAFIQEWTSKHTPTEIIEFFNEIGIPVYSKNGYYYPISNQAKQVTQHIYKKCVDLGVQFMFQTEVTTIKKPTSVNDMIYELIDSKQHAYQCDYLILSTGGAAAPKLGGGHSGYQLSRMLSHTIVPVHAVLSPIYIHDPGLKVAKGVRMDGTVTLYKTKERYWRESGQIQFNESNLSGIVMMNLSCNLPFFREQECQEALHIDFLPAWSWNQLHDYLIGQSKVSSTETIEELLQGIFPSGFVRYLLTRLRINNNQNVSDLSEKQWNRITSTCKKMVFTPIQKEDFDKAQVTAGGVSVKEVSVDTFESHRQKGLYITGELLDVNGICGGYNLTFAMLSGIQAAKDIIQKENNRRFK